MEIWNGKSDEFWAILDTHTHTGQSLQPPSHTPKSYQNKRMSTQRFSSFCQRLKETRQANAVIIEAHRELRAVFS